MAWLASAQSGTGATFSAFRIGREGNRKRALNGGEALVAEAGAHCNALAADGAAAAQHGSAGLGLHARPESVSLHTVAAVGLKCALGHRNALLFLLKNLRFDSISEYIAGRVRNPATTITALRIGDSHSLVVLPKSNVLYPTK
jgi:hypothetical protein